MREPPGTAGSGVDSTAQRRGGRRRRTPMEKKMRYIATEVFSLVISTIDFSNEKGPGKYNANIRNKSTVIFL